MTLEYFLSTIKQRGYKATLQRRAILNVFLELQGHFSTIETIFSNVNKIHPHTNLSTIYRNLDIFISIGVVQKIIFEDGTAMYDLIPNNSHHHHLICKKCGKAEPIDYCPKNEMLQISKSKNFTLTEHKFEMYGYCNDCNTNLNQKLIL